MDLDGTTVKVAVAHGLGNARKLLDKIKAGEADYHFIEIMCCPGGCIGGGGQPIPTNVEIAQGADQGDLREDAGMPMRKSHENPAVKTLYEEFLGKPLGEKSHQLLHTHYVAARQVPEERLNHSKSPPSTEEGGLLFSYTCSQHGKSDVNFNRINRIFDAGLDRWD